MALRFALSALDKYGESPRIAGISLYSPIYNEFSLRPFFPIDDGFDAYFAQTGSSWGAIWTGPQWSRFRAWFSRCASRENSHVPPIVRAWPSESSWKKQFNCFLADEQGYVVFPRFSMTTNMGDAGMHAAAPITHLTSPLSLARDRFRFADLDASCARYDPFLEIEPEALKAIAPSLRDFDFDVDLTGAKELRGLARPYALTCRRSSERDILSFGLKHYPPELNVILQEPGSDIGLRVRNSLGAQPPADLTRRIKDFFRCPMGLRRARREAPQMGVFQIVAAFTQWAKREALLKRKHDGVEPIGPAKPSSGCSDRASADPDDQPGILPGRRPARIVLGEATRPAKPPRAHRRRGRRSLCCRCSSG